MPAPRFVCIHGHFYQPARENPWTGEIPLTPDAYPFHDWNAKIAAECYGPNAWSQIRDNQGRITGVVNNYDSISFNFGPTLLSWLRAHRPEIYRAIIAADRESQNRFGGHGSAIAQCYNHVIMPLASRRDQVTQIRWGIKDFEFHFGRTPRGMWLPETAVDTASLEALAEQGMEFTILAPRQIAATRPLSTREWTRTPSESVDPHHPYVVRLPSGLSIVVFVYHGAIARAVAFEKLLDSGERFAERLLSSFDATATESQLAHIATDGESYGHHHRFGDMALAFALHRLEQAHDVRITNYSEYLSLHPPQHEAQIVEQSSWSCEHGIERWRDDCGCQTGTHLGWNQKWRKPLREAFDLLRDRLDERFATSMSAAVRDPWAARDDFIEIILNPATSIVTDFFGRHQLRRLKPIERKRCIQLLEMQRHLMLMYSSCGWFFDDVSGVEATMLLQQAGRAIDYARVALDEDPEPDFVAWLKLAQSNSPVAGDGGTVYRAASASYRQP